MSKNKLVAYGSNIMVRVPTGNSVIERINPAAQDNIDTEGVVASVGYAVPEGEKLIDRKIRFNLGMVIEMFGDASKDEFVFAMMPHPAIMGVYVSEDESLDS